MASTALVGNFVLVNCVVDPSFRAMRKGAQSGQINMFLHICSAYLAIFTAYFRALNDLAFYMFCSSPYIILYQQKSDSSRYWRFFILFRNFHFLWLI